MKSRGSEGEFLSSAMTLPRGTRLQDQPARRQSPPQCRNRTGEDQRAERASGGDREDVPDRNIPPPAVEQAEDQKPERLGDERHRDRHPQDGNVVGGNREVEPDEEGKGGGGAEA